MKILMPKLVPWHFFFILKEILLHVKCQCKDNSFASMWKGISKSFIAVGNEYLEALSTLSVIICRGFNVEYISQTFQMIANKIVTGEDKGAE